MTRRRAPNPGGARTPSLDAVKARARQLGIVLSRGGKRRSLQQLMDAIRYKTNKK
jgi:hypothetical protein